MGTQRRAGHPGRDLRHRHQVPAAVAGGPATADRRRECTARRTVDPGVRVHWFSRDGADLRPGALPAAAVRDATLPSDRFYTWVAGESWLVLRPQRLYQRQLREAAEEDRQVHQRRP
ncbi:SIP domain-containing protein [Micromonospora sp. LOL_021]|uniref:SIP domain-containing protein n=1 Tax=Micromonospora sp. LOL_021 TaxID=3345417 RepID=UPI003A8B61A1